MALLPSLGLVLLLGLCFGTLAQKCKLPPLVGLIFTGILLGSSGLSLLGTEIQQLSGDLRKIALVIILLKAGLTLQWQRLKTVGTPALLLAFLPATFEILGITLFAPLLLGISTIEAMLLGTVLAAVSPAVVVPRMVSYMECGTGAKGKMPEIVLAGASLDDVLVMVLFSACLSFVEVGSFQFSLLLDIPLSIVSGLLIGVGCGKLLSKHPYFVAQTLELQLIVLLGFSFGFFGLEHVFPFSALLAIMALGLSLTLPDKTPLAQGCTALWKGAEILLFVLVGAEVQLGSALELGAIALVLLLLGLSIRSVGTFLSTATKTKKQRLFAVISYLPKATVQAGIGGIPLALGLDCGQLILTMAVLAILITAPLGAYLIDRYGEGLLEE